jgi:hypothetical protein
VTIGSPPGLWAGCGFAVDNGIARVGQVGLRFEGGDGGISGWTLAGAASTELDGLPTAARGEFLADSASKAPREHPNGAVRVDHLVVFTPDLGRTVAALEAAGTSLRRIREPDEPGPPVRQAFFRLGEVILEVVEEPRADRGPARFWGLTIAVADLDACAKLLGGRLGEIHDAVQPGRRIATLRREAGLGAPVALISA